MTTEPGPDPAASRPDRPSSWQRALQILLVSSLAVFVAGALATPGLRQAMVIALLYALVATGLALVGVIVSLILFVNYWGNNK